MRSIYPTIEMAEKEVRKSLVHYEKIHESLEPVADAYLAIADDEGGSTSSVYIEGDKIVISIVYSKGCGCCRDYYGGAEIPVSLLWSKNLKVDIENFIKQKEINIKKAKAKKEADERAKIREKKAEQKRIIKELRSAGRKAEAKKRKVKREFDARLKKKYG